jgi:hypothetical protein
MSYIFLPKNQKMGLAGASWGTKVDSINLLLLSVGLVIQYKK